MGATRTVRGPRVMALDRNFDVAHRRRRDDPPPRRRVRPSRRRPRAELVDALRQLAPRPVARRAPRLPGGSESRRSRVGRAATRASPPRRVCSNSAPELAIMTGSTTRGMLRPSRKSATVSMTAREKSIPVLAASTPMSSWTASSCARMKSGGKLVHSRHAGRVLSGQRDERGHAVAACSRKSFQVGLDSRSAAGVRASNRQATWKQRSPFAGANRIRFYGCDLSPDGHPGQKKGNECERMGDVQGLRLVASDGSRLTSLNANPLQWADGRQRRHLGRSSGRRGGRPRRDPARRGIAHCTAARGPRMPACARHCRSRRSMCTSARRSTPRHVAST